MATRGISLTIQYVAWDTVNNVYKTGDAGNHTLRWIKDGTAAAPTNSPTEVDATNCPGVYKLTLTASETDCNVGTLAGKSSTANVSLIPVTIQFERLPDAAPGATGGVPTIGSAPLTHLDAAVSSRAPAATALTNATWTDARASKLDYLDAAISSRATDSGVWSHATRTLTAFSFAVDVNMSQTLPASPTSDTTGQALKHSASRLDATVSSRAPASTALSNATWTDSRAAALDNLDATISSRAPAATALSTSIWTNARAANLDNLDATVSSRLAAASYVAPDNASISAIKAKTDQLAFIAGDVVATLDGEQVTVATNNDKTGYSLTAAYDRAKDALTVGEYVAPNNAGISAIKAQTDRLQFNQDNYVYAVAQADVDEQAIIDGVLAGLSGGIQVIVQPLSVRVFEPVGDGGLITFWRYARARAAWYVSADLRGHDLVWLAYTQTDPDTPVSQCSGSEISIEWQGAHARSYVALDAAESKVPAAGTYRYVLRDQTTDAVLLSGVLVVRAAPDAA